MSPCAQIIRSGGVADGRGAAAQAGQRVGLARSTASHAGQFKGLLVMRACATSPERLFVRACSNGVMARP